MPSPGCGRKHTSVHRVLFTVVNNHYGILPPLPFFSLPSFFPLLSYPLSSLSLPPSLHTHTQLLTGGRTSLQYASSWLPIITLATRFCSRNILGKWPIRTLQFPTNRISVTNKYDTANSRLVVCTRKLLIQTDQSKSSLPSYNLIDQFLQSYFLRQPPSKIIFNFLFFQFTFQSSHVI